MTKIVETPSFGSEREEADWWFANQSVIEGMLEEEFGPVPDAMIGVDLAGDDADLLRRQAAAAGIEPQTYAVELLRKALSQKILENRDKAA